jgi:hypothetical protein
MFRLYWQLSTGERRYLYEFATEQEALTARWNWATRGEVYGIESPTGQLI